MVPGYGKALIFQCKFFLCTRENHLPDPSKICALEFKSEFRRFGIYSVSATIGINRSNLLNLHRVSGGDAPAKKTVSPKEDR